MSQFEGDDFSQDIQSGASTAKKAAGAASKVKETKKKIEGAKEAASAVAKSFLGTGKGTLIVIACLFVLILFFCFMSVPYSSLASLWGQNGTSTDEFGNTEALQEQYEEIKKASRTIFESRYNEAVICARKSAEAYAGLLLDAKRGEYDDVSIVDSVVGPHANSQIQSESDITDKVFLMFTIYDKQQQTQTTKEDVEQLYLDKVNAIREEKGTISAEDNETMLLELQTELFPENTTDGFIDYLEANAKEMFSFELPTVAQKKDIGSKCPTPVYVGNASEEDGPYAHASYDTGTRHKDEELDYLIDAQDDDGDEGKEETYCEISYTYEWLLFFDGDNYMLRDFGWVVLDDDGTYQWTEEGERLYEEAVQTAQSYISLIEEEDSDGSSVTSSSTTSREIKTTISQYLSAEDVQTLSFDGQFQMPLSFTKSDISSGVGVRSGVAGYATHMHEGIDIPKSVGTTIQSSTDGIVIAKEMNDTFGYHIVVYAGEQNGTSYFLLYAHCSTISVSVGDKVTAGQNIAAVGQTGRVTGPHLHFGIYSASASGDSKTLNPELILF